MRLRCSLLSLLLLLILGCKQAGSPKVEAEAEEAKVKEVVEELPNSEEEIFTDLIGNTVALSNFRGKRVLLNYWATWCRPCVAEMPSMLRAEDILKDENYVFLLATDQSVATIERFIESRGFEFNYLIVEGTMKAKGLTAIPTTFLYNEKGEKVDTIVGGVSWDSPEILQKLKAVK